MIRPQFLYKSAAGVLVALGIATVCRAQQSGPTPAPELVQYIRDTKRSGVADAKIKSQAVAVGWTASAVDEALAYVRNEKTPPVKASPQTAPPAKETAPPPVTEAPTQQPNIVQEFTSPTPTPALQTPPVSRGVPDDYLIGSGDTLQISVWKEAEASVPAAVVRPDGKITVPLIKEVEVVGLTPTQVEQRITERLTKFIADPNVTVVVATINSKKVYVVGAARKEGPLPYTYGMTVLQALSEAGGLTDYAKRKKIYILRTENGREYRLDFNYDDVLKGQSMEQNALLLPGDTIVIPH